MNPVHILLVEDNEGDILLTQEAFEERKIISQLSVVKNGEDAIDFILQQNAHASAARPDLILLDINLPMKDGHEVLKVIKSNEATKSIPVLMFTTSEAQSDIDKSYKNYANGYVTKPLDMNSFMESILNIEDFWVKLVRLPQKENKK